jgi:hypothetical protein
MYSFSLKLKSLRVQIRPVVGTMSLKRHNPTHSEVVCARKKLSVWITINWNFIFWMNKWINYFKVYFICRWWKNAHIQIFHNFQQAIKKSLVDNEDEVLHKESKNLVTKHSIRRSPLVSYSFFLSLNFFSSVPHEK